MGMTVLERPSAILSPPTEETVPRKKWTRDEYRRMIQEGILENGKYELVLGEVWDKMGQGRRHIAFVTRAFKILGLLFGFDRLQSQSSLPVSPDGDPEPDLAVLAKDMDQYFQEEPPLEEMLLVVEVSDTTLAADLTAKARQYGGAGIPEYWVVDIPNLLLHVFREPNPDGYAREIVLTTEDEVRPLAAPDSAVRVSDLLP